MNDDIINSPEPMDLPPDACPRCGIHVIYHNKKNTGMVIPCIRKKPYKLADGVDVVLGMQVWHFHQHDPNAQIITGKVMRIREWGQMRLKKYPSEHTYTGKVYEDKDGRKIRLPDSRSVWVDYDVEAHHSCYSSLENALIAWEKKSKELAHLLVYSYKSV